MVYKVFKAVTKNELQCKDINMQQRENRDYIRNLLQKKYDEI